MKSTRPLNLLHADRAHFWHPFTQMKEYEVQPPRLIVGAEGVYLFDAEGRRYLDGISSWWVNLVGHRHPRLDQALKAQIDRFSHVTTATLTHEPAIRLAAELAEVLPPGLTHTFYSDDGSTAVETALKMVYQSWVNRGQPQRTRFISLQHSYHGDTLGAVSIGDVAIYHATFKPLLFPVHHAPSPASCLAPVGMDAQVWLEQAVASLRTYLELNADSVAALVVEPLIQCAAGMYCYDPQYLREVRALCDAYDLPLIADEVAVGFGRTGKLFACEHADISPDVICLSKALTGGYLPLGITVANERIYRDFYGNYSEYRTFFHGHSYTGNPLGCALGLEVLAIFRDEGLLEGLPPKISTLQAGFAHLGTLLHAGNVRGMGLISAVELYADPETRTPFKPEQRIGYRVCQAALERGLFVRPLGDVLYLLPPLSITAEQLEWSVGVLEASIQAVLS